MKPSKPIVALALIVATAAAAPVAGPAELHFALETSSPAADSSVPAPDELLLTFTQVPQENSVAVNLIDPAGTRVETGEPTYDAEDRRTMHVDVDPTLAVGAYTVAWRGIGDDGHVVRGDFTFSVTAH